jgi:uncharacterized protein YjbI with pentapeptide repeats
MSSVTGRQPFRRSATPSADEFLANLKEQAQQARTQFFIYLSTTIFLVLTLCSITNKDLLLNNKPVALPLVNVGVPIDLLLWVSPVILTVVYCNWQIHFHRFVKDAQTLQRPDLDCPTFALYQAVFHPKPGLVGVIETLLGRMSAFLLLTPSIVTLFAKGFILHHLGLDIWLVAFLVLAIILQAYWINATFSNFIFRTSGKIICGIVSAFFIIFSYFLCTSSILGLLPKYSINLGVYSYFLFIILSLGINVYYLTQSVIRQRWALFFSLLVAIGMGGIFPLLANTIGIQKTVESFADIGFFNVSHQVISVPNKDDFGITLNDYFAERKDTKILDWYDNVFFLKLNNRNFYGANFYNTVMVKTALSDSMLVRTDLRFANLRGSSLQGTNFGGSRMFQANLTDTRASGANFGYTDLRNSVLDNSILTHASFHHCNLDYASLNGASLYDSEFSDATLRNTNLTGVSFEADYFVSDTATTFEREKTELSNPPAALCQAKTLQGATMERWLYDTLAKEPGCKAKLNGVKIVSNRHDKKLDTSRLNNQWPPKD